MDKRRYLENAAGIALLAAALWAVIAFGEPDVEPAAKCGHRQSPVEMIAGICR